MVTGKNNEGLVKINERTHYSEEDDYYVIVTSLHGLDEMEEDEEIDDEMKQICTEAWIECLRNENEIDDDYSDYEITRQHLKTDGAFTIDYYYQWGIGEITLSKK
jgi:hypothetical protein